MVGTMVKTTIVRITMHYCHHVLGFFFIVDGLDNGFDIPIDLFVVVRRSLRLLLDDEQMLRITFTEEEGLLA